MQRWNNKATAYSTWECARDFATQYLSGERQTTAFSALAAFASGEPKRAKNILSAVPISEFGDSQEYLVWAQFRALFAKSCLPGDSRRRETVARDAFLASERSCKRANKRLRWFAAHPDRLDPDVRVVLTRAKGLISQVLGNFTERTLEHILELSRPGGGTCIGTLHPDKVTLPWKLGSGTKLAVTAPALPYARMLIESSPAWLRLHADVDWPNSGKIENGPLCVQYRMQYEVVPGNRVAFVPKDATTARTIAVEPHLNLCLQLGTCEYMASRLRAVGLNLQDQGRNQAYARKGASEWQQADPYVTLDLSAASDSMPTALVEWLLPPVWKGFLDDIRSPKYTLGKEPPAGYEKWSSMGNGTTFPLETLVFWALGRACSSLTAHDTEVVVYGDDIVVRRGVAAFLVQVLNFVGFRVNRDKSYLFGPFRESCGEDWWENDRVVPVYLRYIDYLRPTDIYRTLNLLSPKFRGGMFEDCLLRAHKGRPVIRGLKDSDPAGHLWTPLDDLKWPREIWRDSGLQAFRYYSATFRPNKARTRQYDALAAALLGDRRFVSVPRILVRGSELPEAWTKSTLRARGQWTLVSKVGG